MRQTGKSKGVNKLKGTLKVALVLSLVLVLLAGSVVVAQGAAIRMGLEAKHGRYKAWTVVVDDTLFIFGGEDWEEPTPTEYYNFKTGEWAEYGVESWPPAGENSAVVVVNGNIFCLGGENETGTNKKVYLFDIEDGDWEVLPGQASQGHSDAGAAVIGEKIYMVGGEDDDLANEGFEYAAHVDIYNTKTNRWERGTDCPLPRQDTFVVALGTDIYLLGGQGGNIDDSMTANVMIYDTINDSWSQGPDLPYPWEHPRAAVVDGKMYVMTGKGEGGYYIFELDPAVNEWREMESYNLVTRYGSGITVYEGEIYVACGRNMTGEAQSSIEIYNPALDNYVD
jgi:N-acetylneuraminic acid mutarotase